MDPNQSEERRKNFRKELFSLREKGYLSEAIVDTVARAHHQYHLDLLEMETEPPSTEINVPIKAAAPEKPKKVKKKLTPEEIRERNITWLLNIGVIFLLIGGLFVATSNWESMTSFMKSGSIAVVALLFYGTAFLTKKVLKIEKTAFAFSVLGSLFLPIFILSLGWFGLLGTIFINRWGGALSSRNAGEFAADHCLLFIRKKLRFQIICLVYLCLDITRNRLSVSELPSED